ncbi:MAG: hypothetical protein QCI00_02585 [Candidatus Thermoplasmatota archaeon]|nr:hypothetical protein [Candidatus Thermoplasmatota archaeon]
MGRYQRKPHKKQRMDFYLHRLKKDEIKDELDLFFNKTQEESILFLNEEPMLFKDEPDIVKELREEELHGRLPLWLADFKEEKNNDSIPETDDPTEETIKETKETGNYHISQSKKINFLMISNS